MQRKNEDRLEERNSIDLVINSRRRWRHYKIAGGYRASMSSRRRVGQQRVNSEAANARKPRFRGLRLAGDGIRTRDIQLGKLSI